MTPDLPTPADRWGRTPRTPGLRQCATVAAVGAALVAAGCTSAAPGTPRGAAATASDTRQSTSVTITPSRPSDSAAAAIPTIVGPPGCGTTLTFDPANFVDPTMDTNPYHPLKPGIRWVRGGSTLVGQREVPHQIITTMTDVIRTIDGVPTVAMLDESTDSGEVSQVGMDYLALDRLGNVWILGGYTEEFQGGQYTNTELAWLGRGDGQTVGVLVPAVVDGSTPAWCIGAAPGEAASVGEPVKVSARECVPFGCFDAVRVIQEGNVGAPDNEHKFYAPGVGVIKNVPLDASLHKDRFELLNILTVGADGLAEASRTVQGLEAHARTTVPTVFGRAPVSVRAS